MNKDFIEIDENEVRDKIKTAITNRKSIKNVNVEKIVEKIRKELGNSEQINDNYNSIYLPDGEKNYIDDKTKNLTGWYSICKKINLRLRKISCYNKIFSPIIESVKRRVPQSAKYDNNLSYKKLFIGNNTEFIYNAYSKFLLRSPDPAGFENYLNMLVRVNGNRILVLGAIRYSLEGKKNDIQVKGLYTKYKMEKAMSIVYRIPILGYLVRWIKDIITLPRKFNNLFGSIVQQNISNEDLYKTIDKTNENLYKTIDKTNEELDKTIDRIKDEFNITLEDLKFNINKRISENSTDIENINLRFEKIQEENKIKEYEEEKIKSEMDEVYLKFENQFRGTKSEIKKRLNGYIPIIENVDIQNNHDHTNVVDVGCGRGEWLELLKENRFVYTGVDLNESMVKSCKELNLNVVEADAISYLSKLEDSSVYVITGFQIVEHIGSENIVRLLKESYRVLKPGGMAIFETPNPENLIIGACNFYFDSTHIRPIPPAQLQFFAESSGFDRVDILRLHPYNVIDIEKLDTKNEEILKMANFFNNTTDYSILAYKE